MSLLEKPSFSNAKFPETAEEEWDSDNSMVMTWLRNSMEPYIFANFTFNVIAKAIWDVARATYSLENNTSRVFEVYEEVFNLRQGDKSVALL